VSPRALAVAEPWTLALVGAVVLAMLANLLLLSPPGGDEFSLDAASLTGRVDRQLTLSFCFATLHAWAVCIASSGLRWGLSPVSLPSWLGRWLSAPLVHGAPLGLPGAPFTYRTATTQAWFVIALEAACVIATVVLGGEQLDQALALPYANLLPLALLVVPCWQLFLQAYGRITFRVEEGCLLTRHFPFRSRNRRIPVVDVRGIQVNSELDDKGVVTHYSLLLVRDHSGTDRLIDKLPSAEHARALAQRIDSLLRLSTTGTH